MTRVVTVKFRTAGKHYDFNAKDLELKPADKVIVETDRGRALGIIVTAPMETADNNKRNLKNVIRHATEEDLQLALTNAAREEDALRYCRSKVFERKMDMKLVKAEYLFDGSKIIFYFTADGRVDFRELVKDLAHHFHTRIEMRQIGVRDEAKLIGGIGICGQALCCCSFLSEFSPVSVKMAKEQQLALNPSKISGQCGRLLCCLSYEYETYCKLRKGLPKNGLKLTVEGLNAYVTETDILRQKVSIRIEDGRNLKLTREEFKIAQESGKLPENEPQPDLEAPPEPKPRPESSRPQENGDEQKPKRKRRRRRRKPGAAEGEKSPQKSQPQKEGGSKEDGAKKNQRPERKKSTTQGPKPKANQPQGDRTQQQPKAEGNQAGAEQKKKRRRRRRKPGPKPESADKS